MKMNKNFNSAEKSGDFESSGFTIDASPHAFQILSASLYSNKVQSVIRELSTNALDEHINADVERPFEVHLPTGFESWFSIRDFGTGLSENDAVTLYTTFFKSTKRNSNTQIGCLGLGSKSPFAVTDSFTVESIHDGKKTVYTCYKDSGRPIISKVHSEPSNEPTGVMVKFAVENDFWEWEHEAKRIYKFFAVKPKLFNNNGEIKIDLDLPKVIMQGEGWSIHDDLDGNFAVMGNVAYPITFGSMNIDDPEDAIMIRDLAQVDGLVFRYTLGSINFLPSREGLEYDRTTKAALVSSAKAMRDDMISMMTDRVESQPSLYKARVEYVKTKERLIDFFPSIDKGTLGGKIKSMVPKWGGDPIFDKSITNTTLVKVDHLLFCRGRKNGSVTITNETEHNFHYFDEDEDMVVFVCPAIKGHRERVRKYSSTNETRCILLTNDQARLLADSIGHDGDVLEIFKDASALPKSRQTRTFKIIEAEINSNGLKISGPGTINDSEETFYCIRNKDEILYIDEQGALQPLYLNEAIAYATKIGMKLPQKCVTMTHYEYKRKNVEDNGNMINLADEVMRFLAKYLNDNIQSVISEFSKINSHYFDGNMDINNWLISIKKHISEKHPLSTIFGEVKKPIDWWAMNGNSVFTNVCSILSKFGKVLVVTCKDQETNQNKFFYFSNGHTGTNRMLEVLGGCKKRTNAYEIYGMVKVSDSMSGSESDKAKSIFDLMASNPAMPKIELKNDDLEFDLFNKNKWKFEYKGDMGLNEPWTKVWVQ